MKWHIATVVAIGIFISTIPDRACGLPAQSNRQPHSVRDDKKGYYNCNTDLDCRRYGEDSTCNTYHHFCRDCTADEDCGSGQICWTYFRWCVDGCRTNEDCMPHQVCDTYDYIEECADLCDSDQDCTASGRFCRDGWCQLECYTVNDGYCPAGKFCDEWFNKCADACAEDEDCDDDIGCVDYGGYRLCDYWWDVYYP